MEKGNRFSVVISFFFRFFVIIWLFAHRSGENHNTARSFRRVDHLDKAAILHRHRAGNRDTLTVQVVQSIQLVGYLIV